MTVTFNIMMKKIEKDGGLQLQPCWKCTKATLCRML